MISNEQMYVLAILSGVLRAEIEKLKEQGIRATAAGRVDPAKVLALFEQLLARVENKAIPF